MTSFFTAINPLSTDSGVTFAATNRKSWDTGLKANQELPDITVETIIHFLWHQNLPLWDGITAAYFVLAGDHFDRNGVGFGHKGILDFTLLPLLARQLIANTHLPSRKDATVLNAIAWIIALPIQFLTVSLASACMLAVIPIVFIVTTLRWLGAFGASPVPEPTTYSSLMQGVAALESMEICTAANIKRLLENPINLTILASMQQLLADTLDQTQADTRQQLFDLFLDCPAFYCDDCNISQMAEKIKSLVSTDKKSGLTLENIKTFQDEIAASDPLFKTPDSQSSRQGVKSSRQNSSEHLTWTVRGKLEYNDEQESPSLSPESNPGRTLGYS